MSALNLINDVLNTGTLQAKRNALTALRIVGTQESIGKLVGAAVTLEGDLHERAVAEILQLDAARTELARRSLREEAQNPRTRDLAYRVYGLLGWRIDGTIGARILNALRLAGTLYRGQSWQDFPARMMPDALVAAASAALVLSAALMAVLDLIPNGMGEIFLWSSLIAVSLSAIAAWRASPIGLQSAGGWPALATEIVIPGLTVSAVAAALGLAVLGSMSILTDFAGFSAASAVVAALALGATVSAVRAGSALAHRLFDQHLLDRLAPTFAGAAAGIAVLSAATSWLRLDLSASASSYVDYAWPALACAAFGVAAGFGRIDAQAPTKTRPMFGNLLRGTVALAIIGSVGFAGVLAFVRFEVPVDAVLFTDDVPDDGIIVERTPFLIRLDGSNSGARPRNLAGDSDDGAPASQNAAETTGAAEAEQNLIAAIEEESDYENLVLRHYSESRTLLADADSPAAVPLQPRPGENSWLAVLRYQGQSLLDLPGTRVADMFPALTGVASRTLDSRIDARTVGPLATPVTLRLEPPLAFEDKVTVSEEARRQITQIPYVLPIEIPQRGSFVAELIDASPYSNLSIRLYDAKASILDYYFSTTSFRKRLDPGTYFVVVGSYLNEASFNSIADAVVQQRNQAPASVQALAETVELSLQLHKPVTGLWQLGEPAALPINVRVTELPFSATFIVPTEATFDAEVGSHREDLLLRIYDDSGMERAYADDPPGTRQLLPAGTYYAVVSLYGDEEVSSIPDSLASGNLSLDIARFPLPDPPRLTIQAIAPQRVSLALDGVVVPTEPFEIATLPFILPLLFSDDRQLNVDADISYTNLDLVVDLYSEDGLLYADADDPPVLGTRVDPGAYYLLVREYGVLEQETPVRSAIQNSAQSVDLLLDDIPPVMISVSVE